MFKRMAKGLFLAALAMTLSVQIAFADMSEYLISVETDAEGRAISTYDLSLIPEGTILPNSTDDEEIDENANIQQIQGVSRQSIGISPMNAPLISNWDVSINFLYGNAYYENYLNFGQTLTVEAYAKNSTTASKAITLYAATYDNAGKLLQIFRAQGTITNNGVYQAISVNVILPTTNTTGYKVKAFVWDETSLQPYVNSVTLTGTANNDYHANAIGTANFVNYTKPINGRINTATDVDFIKFVPATTGDYIIQTTGTTNTAGILYNSSQASIATNNNISSADTNFAIRQTLTANQVYYVRVAGESSATGDYTLTISPYTRNISPTVVNGYVYVNGSVGSTVGNSQSATVKLLNASGTVLTSQSVTTTSAGALTSTLSNTLANNTQYRIVVISGGKLQEVADIKTLTSTKSFALNTGEYCDVPFALTNVATLGNVEFSLSYAAADFELYDVCEATQAVETGTGAISSGYLNVTGVSTTYAAFKSTRSISSGWSGVANVVKLRAKRTATMNAVSYIYQVK